MFATSKASTKTTRRYHSDDDDENLSSSDANGAAAVAAATKSRQQRRLMRLRTSAVGRGGAEENKSGSLIWTFLVIGVIFCLIDTIYIMRFVLDRHDARSIPTTSAASRSVPNDLAQTETDNKAQLLQLVPPNMQSAAIGKEPILQLLNEAGITNLDPDIIEKLPKWSEVVAMYGEQPVYYGLDQCQRFQQMGDPAEHFVSTAGTFNTGTNLMAELLIHNCHMPERIKKYGQNNRGVRWQVLWGKHTPVGDEEFRQTHRTYVDPSLTANNIFPAVTVRDPFKWMQSMCRHEYGAHWPHTSSHCPNLIASAEDIQLHPEFELGQPVPVSVKYAEFTKEHDNLADFWNDWYNEYIDAPFPRLMVRFEDVIFHPKEVTKTVCECAGGELDESHPFTFIVNSAKKGEGAHGKERTSYIDALIKYGTERGRYNGFDEADLQFAKEHLDPKLMTLFGYPFPATEGKEE